MQLKYAYLCLDAACEEIGVNPQGCAACGGTAVASLARFLNRPGTYHHTCVDVPSQPCPACGTAKERVA